MQKRQTVLAVDLDHSLIDTDMIYLGMRQLIHKKIYLLPYLFYLRFFKGKPHAKEFLYRMTNLDIDKLPFNNELIDYINKEKHKYDHIILISGSYYKYVQSIFKHLRLFDSFAGTDLMTNMISENKVKYLNKQFHNPIFDYVGDSKKDLPIWELSRRAFVVDHGNILKKISHLKYKVVSKRY
jgi:phosphoserine phosphatase